jgi:hypothetical protein
MISIIRQELKKFKFKVVPPSIWILYFSWRGPCTTCCTNLTFKEELNVPLNGGCVIVKNVTYLNRNEQNLTNKIWRTKFDEQNLTRKIILRKT